MNDSYGRNDIDRAVAGMSSTFLSKKALRNLAQYVPDGESVLVIEGAFFRDSRDAVGGGDPGIVVLTDHRLLHLDRGGKDRHDFVLETLVEVGYSNGLLKLKDSECQYSTEFFARGEGQQLADQLIARLPRPTEQQPQIQRHLPTPTTNLDGGTYEVVPPQPAAVKSARSSTSGLVTFLQVLAALVFIFGLIGSLLLGVAYATPKSASSSQVDYNWALAIGSLFSVIVSAAMLVAISSILRFAAEAADNTRTR